MYDYIKGYINQIDINSIVIENNDIGFRVLTSKNSIDQFSKSLNKDEKITIFTKMIVKEDDISLCGFSSREELEVFNLLTSVSGVGTKVGVALLSSSYYKDIAKAIISSDLSVLTAASGVGNKTAQRIVLELKDKVNKLFVFSDESNDTSSIIPVNSLVVEDAMNALISLGYTKNEVKKTMNKINISSKTTEELIKELLKLINK
ncbi:Holliday junction branch migration protein RuvA [Helicovermis profundi]|uniref:Holliday junction branch migration complex subunit RuvA n=1 Tax=Helicovermis profundi TaxID=3065157 RepID=A0AAU9EEL0_9FIRM|nr:Holliday junction branch migration protein RuvA [Clostridia bacterium S502]